MKTKIPLRQSRRGINVSSDSYSTDLYLLMFTRVVKVALSPTNTRTM